MKKMKMGVIGVGSLGQHHARIYSELENSELIGVYDSDINRAKEIAEKNNSKYFKNIDELLEQVEAVSIAVPTNLHHKVAEQCLNKKIHCLIEKPITSTIEEAHQLLKIAQENNLTLQVGHIERFNSAIVALNKLIKRPGFIETERLAPFNIRGTEVSVVLDLMIHDIDIVLSIVKSPVKQILASGVPVFTKNEDIANARLVFENGCTANLTASRISVDRKRKIRIFEPAGYYSVDYMTQTIMSYKKKDITEITAALQITDMVDMETIKIESEEPLKSELESFVNCVSKGKRPIVPGEHGRYALEIAMKIIDNIRKTSFI